MNNYNVTNLSYFYSHLVNIESIAYALDRLDISDEQKEQLAGLVDSSLHHSVLDAILSQLQDEDKKAFLYHFKSGNHDQIWNFLNKKIENIEERIIKAAEDLKLELHKDLKEAKNG